MKITVTKRIEVGGKAVEHSATAELPDRGRAIFSSNPRALVDGVNTDLAEERARALFAALPPSDK